MSADGFVEEEATVVAVEGRMAWIQAQRQSSCGACAAAKGCGSAALGKVLGNRVSQVRALNPIGARVGDRVVVGVRSRALVRGALWLYGLPLAGMIGLPLGVGLLFAPEGLSEGWQALLALLGLGGSLYWLAGRGGRLGQDPELQAVILRRCTAADGAVPVVFHNNKTGVDHG